MLTLAFIPKHCCAKIQPQKAASMAVDSCSCLMLQPFGRILIGYFVLGSDGNVCGAFRPLVKAIQTLTLTA